MGSCGRFKYEIEKLTHPKLEVHTIVRRMFSSTADDSVTNTTAETAFAPAGVGSPTIASNSLKVGDVIRVTASGILSTV